MELEMGLEQQVVASSLAVERGSVRNGPSSSDGRIDFGGGSNPIWRWPIIHRKFHRQI
eukprot:COSAG06_NODE_28774_length_568_cov_1.281450_1_plen_57_part_10